jgi:uncharacterized protein involved in type VI secretion and phage assembly
MTGPIPGVVIGIVEETKGDPAKLGRIKVRFPWLGGTILSNWCRVASFAAGKSAGAYFLPARGDEVLVAFDSGNVNVPYVIGALWNGIDVPPVAAEEAQQNVRMIKTRSGASIRIDDTSGSEKIEIFDKNQNTISIDTAKNKITIASKGELAVSAAEKLTIDAAEVEITSKGSVKISGATGELSGKTDLALSSATIRLN